MKVVYHPVALAQLDEILDYIGVRSPAGAQRVAAAIKHSINLLAEFPRSGRASAVDGIRELPIVRYPHIDFYTIDDVAGDVIILRVRHTSRNPKHHLD